MAKSKDDDLNFSAKIGCELTDNSANISANLKTNSKAFTALDYVTGGLLSNWYKKQSIKSEIDCTKLSQILLDEQLFLAERERQLLLYNQDTKIITKAVKDDPEYRVSLLIKNENTRKICNRYKIAEFAAKELEYNPLEKEDKATIDQDYMNLFNRYAEDISSEEFQQIWGKILAQKIRDENSISKKTLRILSEIEPSIAQDFEEISRRRIGKYVVKRYNHVTISVLVEAGLFKSLESANIELEKAKDGFCYIPNGNNYCIKYKPQEDKDFQVQSHRAINIDLISDAGIEILKALNLTNEFEEIENFALDMAKIETIEKIYICEIARKFEDSTDLSLVKTIKA